MRVVFLIRRLGCGGAERQLVALVRNLDQNRFSVTVVTYYSGGELAEALQGLPNVRVVSADKRGRWDLVGFISRLRSLVREVRPQVVHGYMYGANELALLLARAVGARVIWGVRASGLDMRYYDWMTRLLYRTGAWLSSRVDAVIANSEAGRRFHIELGYPAQRFFVIPNGIDTDLYRYDDEARRRVRARWNVSETEVLIGVVARLDPMKDHETFLQAAAVLVGTGMAVRFVIVGAGSQQQRLRVERITTRLNLDAQVVWAGGCQDMPAVYSAIDIVTSSSAFGEGFSNSLAEAMACERVCVSTDVGDARAMLGLCGEIVPPRQPETLAAAWRKVLELSSQGRAARGRQARERVIDNFSVATLATRTSEVLLRIAAGGELGVATL